MKSEMVTSEVKVPPSKATMQFAKPKTEQPYQADIDSAAIDQNTNYKRKIVWKNVIIIVILHSMALYGFYLTLTVAKISTTLCCYFVGYLSLFGVTAGSHRLWSHRSYKATLFMRTLLMLMHTIANQDPIYYWVRDHRVHHKYTDTDADPYNSSKGFFFAHMGWLMLTKHPNVKKFGKRLDLSDLASDPVVVFQMKLYSNASLFHNQSCESLNMLERKVDGVIGYFWYIMPLLSVIIPTWIPMYFWNETFKVSFFVTMYRYVWSLHVSWSTNALAHWWGYKTYDKSCTSTDNPYTGIITLGESWHNYHHAFPWDYTVPEVPFFTFHPSGKLIEFFALFGLTYDLKTVSVDLARRQANRKGDGTFNKFSHNSTAWGWDDVDLRPTDRSGTEIHS